MNQLCKILVTWKGPVGPFQAGKQAQNDEGFTVSLGLFCR